MFDQEAYNNFLIENKVIGFFDEPITLKSGRISNWYANCRDLLDKVGVINKLTDFVLAFVEEKSLSCDYFYGVPEGATKLGLILSYRNGGDEQVLVIGRGKPKEHGAPKDKYFIGPVKKGDKVIVIEDVTTTGGSLLDTIRQLQEAYVDVVAAVGLVNRMEKRDDGKSVKEAVEELGVDYFAIGSALELLPMAAESLKPSDSVLKHVEEYFDKYGVEALKL